jgi:3-phosphoshikimate 1-carboxyvinyltransferase
VPPSKSYTNRALIAAALADGSSSLQGPSRSDDSKHLVTALRHFGVEIEQTADALHVAGTNGSLRTPGRDVFVGNAGTAMRFLTSLAGLAPGETTLTCGEQMRKRPMTDLIVSLNSAGIKCSSADGFPPVTVRGGNFPGGTMHINGATSSQFVSSILLVAPYAKRPTLLHVLEGISSTPYIDMTTHVMRSFGASVDNVSSSVYTVGNASRYIGRTFAIEGDASAATYFFAAAAITGGTVTVTNLPAESLQGDLRFLHLLRDMGCTVVRTEDATEIRGGKLFGIEAAMNDIPDCVPTLAVIAAFAKGTTTIQNVGHLRHKETDRLRAIATELRKLGAGVELFDDGIAIHPQALHGAEIETYNDHRIAMSFAVAGLVVPGMRITNPGCVSKSFPDFWEAFSVLERKN